MKENLILDHKYTYDTTVVITVIKDGEREIRFEHDDKIAFRCGSKVFKCMPGLFEPKSGDVVTYVGIHDGFYLFDCDNVIRFNDINEIDRSAVYEVMKEIGLDPSQQDADIMLSILRIWPREASKSWTPNDYLNRMLEIIEEKLKMYSGSHNGSMHWHDEQRVLFNLLFGFKASEFICTIVNESYMSEFKLDFHVVFETKTRRYIELTVDNVPLSEVLDQYGIEIKRISYECPVFGSDVNGLEEEKLLWWNTPYHAAWLQKKEDHDRVRAEQEAEYEEWCKERGIENNKSSSVGLGMLLGAANASDKSRV